jgi:hypothetical protein
MEREQYKGLTIRLEQDQDCENPLDNDAGVVFVTYRADARSQYGNTPLDQEEHEEVARKIQAGELIGLPVYVYEHGGVIIKAEEGNPFSCPWDSGQSGYVYCTRKTALEWQGGKVLTAKRRAAVLKGLQCSVDAYSSWCNGECYGYIIEGADGEELESCWGFIGDEYAMEEAKRSADYWAPEVVRRAKNEVLAARCPL